MNLEFFIAKRLASNSGSSGRLSRLMSYISIISIALGIAVMIVSVAIVTGFRTELSGKLIGSNAHIQITNLDSNSSFETNPINAKQSFLDSLKNLSDVSHIQKYITKGGIIRADEDIQGVMFKGIDTDFDWSFFKNYLVEGEIFSVNTDSTTNKILISKTQANLLKLKTGDKINVYFVQESLRTRRFTIAGIYETHVQEIDKALALCDIKHLQKIYGWTKDQISGFEISIKNVKNIDKVTDKVEEIVLADNYELTVMNIQQMYPNFFMWLHLIDTNVWIILALTIAVAIFNMVSGLLIMLLERTQMIGILKSLGMPNINIRKLFLYRAGFIVLKGLIFGNILGLLYCILQQQFGIVKLDASSYFMSVVPINLNFWHVVLLNICSLAIIMIVLIIPSKIITNISPDKTIRFE